MGGGRAALGEGAGDAGQEGADDAAEDVGGGGRAWVDATAPLVAYGASRSRDGGGEGLEGGLLGVDALMLGA